MFIELGVIADGSISGVMDRRKYNRAASHQAGMERWSVLGSL